MFQSTSVSMVSMTVESRGTITSQDQYSEQVKWPGSKDVSGSLRGSSESKNACVSLRAGLRAQELVTGTWEVPAICVYVFVHTYTHAHMHDGLYQQLEVGFVALELCVSRCQ